MIMECNYWLHSNILYHILKNFMSYKMERLVEVTLSKVNILSILDCYYRLFPLIYISYDSKGITIQESCEDRKILATTVIPRDSFDSYECKESMVLAVPYHLRNWVVDALALTY